jgi:hypothetical protein
VISKRNGVVQIQIKCINRSEPEPRDDNQLFHPRFLRWGRVLRAFLAGKPIVTRISANLVDRGKQQGAQVGS